MATLFPSKISENMVNKLSPKVASVHSGRTIDPAQVFFWTILQRTLRRTGSLPPMGEPDMAEIRLTIRDCAPESDCAQTSNLYDPSLNACHILHLQDCKLVTHSYDMYPNAPRYSPSSAD